MPQLLHGTLLASIFEVDRIQNACGFGLCRKVCYLKFMDQRILFCVASIFLSSLSIILSLLKLVKGIYRLEKCKGRKL